MKSTQRFCLEAQVKDVAHGVYVGDPLGQARAKGIKPGMVASKMQEGAPVGGNGVLDDPYSDSDG